MKLLSKALPAGLLALVLTILPVSAFAGTGLHFIESVSYPLATWSHLFLLVGFGMWIYLQESKCCHHLILYTLLGYILGVFLGGVIPGMLFGVSIVALLLILMGVLIVAKLKIHHIGAIVLALIVGFFVGTGVGGIALTAVGVLSFIGMLVGVFLGLTSGYGAYTILKDHYKGKIVMGIGIIIGLLGLLKLFAIM